MRVFVFEHLCGGGERGPLAPPGIVAQGAAMREALCRDFHALGARVLTLQDERAPAPPREAETEEMAAAASRAAVEAAFDQAVARCDRVLVVAPEAPPRVPGLAEWLNRVPPHKRLGPTPWAAVLCGDKLRVARRLARAGLATPSTWNAAAPPPLDLARAPILQKPRWGAGGEGIAFCARSGAAAPCEDGRVRQAWASGAAASASFVVRPDGTWPLRAGRQRVRVRRDGAVSFAGGALPLAPERERRALDLGRRAVEAIDGLGGFVGVDLVLGPSGAHDTVIEINPRPTLSYVALQRLVRDNLARLLVEGGPPPRWERGRVRFNARGGARLGG